MIITSKRKINNYKGGILHEYITELLYDRFKTLEISIIKASCQD